MGEIKPIRDEQKPPRPTWGWGQTIWAIALVVVFLGPLAIWLYRWALGML